MHKYFFSTLIEADLWNDLTEERSPRKINYPVS